MPEPLVTVGIPTFNRSRELARAVASVLAQDHPNLEVVISDDASSDDTAEVGTSLAAADPRVRFFTQPRNLGHHANYQWVLEAARGEYFMWLSDDDWLEPAYVARCLAALRVSPDVVLACGLARYHRPDGDSVDERPIDLRSPRPGTRVIRYFARVSVNGPLFGVMRREDLLAVGFPDMPGGDWLLVATMAARGHVCTLRDVRMHRSLAGLGTDPAALARSFGQEGLRVRHHHLWVAWTIPRRVPVGRFAQLASAVLIAARFSGVAALRRVGLGRLEPRVAAWMRSRDV